MQKVQYNFCGSSRAEKRRVNYLYSHKGKYLLVPNTPIEVCADCSMIYYDVAVLKEIEAQFFVIQQQEKQPDEYLQIPFLTYRT
jgi:YgiT-type zinc finger domain-containing protein